MMSPDELWKAGGAAGILAGAVFYLYRRQSSISAERIESYKSVVERLEAKLADKQLKIDELHGRIEEILRERD